MKQESLTQEKKIVATNVVEKCGAETESTQPSAYGLRVARELLKNTSALSNSPDGAMIELILALPSPAKEKAFVDFCLTGEVPEEVLSGRPHRAAA